MKSSFCFCTCAENNKEMYLQRVEQWRDMLRPLAHLLDLYVVVDGYIPENEFPEGVTPLCITPKLGRVTVKDFPGWKRSYVFALRYAQACGYTKVFHCENDVEIINYDKVKEYLDKDGLFSSIDERYNFIETAFQIINDIPAMNDVLEHYDRNGYYEDVVAEKVVQRKAPFQYPFKSIRQQGHSIDRQQYDYIPQSK